MTLRDASGSFVLDFSELASEVYQTVLRYEEKGDRQLLREASDMVYTMIDDYITTQLYWARPKRPSADSRDYRSYEHYGGGRRRGDNHYNVHAYRAVDVYDQYRGLLSKIPPRNRNEMVERVSDKMSEMILDHMDLPTWRIVHLTRQRSMVLIEVQEDFRIEEWMKEHGPDYGFK